MQFEYKLHYHITVCTSVCAKNHALINLFQYTVSYITKQPYINLNLSNTYNVLNSLTNEMTTYMKILFNKVTIHVPTLFMY